VVAASPAGSATEQPAAPPPAEKPGTPWERRRELGVWKAWSDTIVAALFEPAKLFDAARTDQGGAQVGFAVLTISVFAIIGQLLNRFLLAPWREKVLQSLRAQGISNPFLDRLMAATYGHGAAAVIAVVLLTPLVAYIVVYLNAAVTHAFAMLLGQNKRGFAATFAACAYACAPLAFLALPGCGELIGLVWAIVLTGIGLKHTHGMASGGATATVLAPYALWCCGLCALGALIGVLRGGMSP
jgi:hypothetical protein